MLAVGAAVLCACSGANEPVDGGHGAAHDPIIGGVDARSADLDAIGSLAAELPHRDADGVSTPRYRQFCSAALVGSATALTAKHCARFAEKIGAAGGTVYFAIGADAMNPRRKVEVVDDAQAPTDTGGFLGLGSDVAVLHLKEEVTDLQPMRIAQLADGDVGEPFVAVGYGYRDSTRAHGQRLAGTVTLRARRGNAFDLLLGSFDAFEAWARSVGVGASPDGGAQGDAVADEGLAAWVASDGVAAPIGGVTAATSGDDKTTSEQSLRALYDQGPLLEGYQAVVGGSGGDAQPCHGDSGGPMVRRTDGESRIYGVASAALPGDGLPCDFGAVYATFGPATYAFVANAESWSDPCAGIPSHGQCDGTVATRCTSPLEGRRRVTRTDCSALGQACGFNDRGDVACVSPGDSTSP